MMPYDVTPTDERVQIAADTARRDVASFIVRECVFCGLYHALLSHSPEAESAYLSEMRELYGEDMPDGLVVV